MAKHLCPFLEETSAESGVYELDLFPKRRSRGYIYTVLPPSQKCGFMLHAFYNTSPLVLGKVRVPGKMESNPALVLTELAPTPGQSLWRSSGGWGGQTPVCGLGRSS